MKKSIGFLIMAIALFSCTGGNESVIGKPGLLDYMPSIFMIVGGIGTLIGIFIGVTGKDFSARAKQIAVWSFLVFVFGLVWYFTA